MRKWRVLGGGWREGGKGKGKGNLGSGRVGSDISDQVWVVTVSSNGSRVCG